MIIPLLFAVTIHEPLNFANLRVYRKGVIYVFAAGVSAY
jgi:hypothetical protein